MANSVHKFNNQGMHFITYHRGIKENGLEELKRWERCIHNKLGKCYINCNNLCTCSNYCSKLELGQFQIKLKTKYDNGLENKTCAGRKNDICIITDSIYFNKPCIGYMNCEFKADTLILIKENPNKNLSPSEIDALRKSKIALYKNQSKKTITKKNFKKKKDKNCINKQDTYKFNQNTKTKLISHTDFQKSCQFFFDANCKLFDAVCKNNKKCTFYKKINI